jgi:adenylosuccinate synthase
MIADIIVDLQYGDCGKGKVSHYLCEKNDYTHVLRYNGGGNAGHTIYHDGKKFITHYLPSGVFSGVRSVIGSGCVIHIGKLMAEMKGLEEAGFDLSCVKIARNCHVVTDEYLELDKLNNVVGTTLTGNGEAYTRKYARTGLRAESVPELQPYLVDLIDEWRNYQPEPVVLCEGAQGFGLDIDWGDYPYVTSSHCTVAGALLNAIPYSAVRDVWGIAKVYETYVGAKTFESDDPKLKQLRELGGEYGATTGRPRQCNWINLDLLKRAIWVNKVNKLVFNKLDILRQLGSWNIISGGSVLVLEDEAEFREALVKAAMEAGMQADSIMFSESPLTI